MWGAVVSGAVTALGAVTFLLAFMASLHRPRARGSLAVPLLFGTIAIYLVLASLRQFAAAASDARPAFVAVDHALFLVVLVPASLTIVPLVYLIAAILWPSARARTAAVLLFLAPVLVGLAYVYVGGIDGPHVSDWGTDWTLRSIVPRIMLLTVILLPSVAGSLMLIRLSRRLGPDAVRVRRVGWACLLFFTVFTLDAFGLEGIPLLTARAITAFAGVVAWRAYPRPGAQAAASLWTREAWRRKARPPS